MSHKPLQRFHLPIAHNKSGSIPLLPSSGLRGNNIFSILRVFFFSSLQKILQAFLYIYTFKIIFNWRQQDSIYNVPPSKYLHFHFSPTGYPKTNIIQGTSRGQINLEAWILQAAADGSTWGSHLSEVSLILVTVVVLWILNEYIHGVFWKGFICFLTGKYIMDNHEVASSVKTPARTVTSVAAGKKPLIDCHLSFVLQASAESLLSGWSAHALRRRQSERNERNQQSSMHIHIKCLFLNNFCHKSYLMLTHLRVQQHQMTTWTK